MISVEESYPLLADLGDQFAEVLKNLGVSSADAFFFICLLILQFVAFFALKDDLKDDLKGIKDDIEDLSDTFSMAQQFNTYASSRPPRPWALTSSRSHSHRERSVPRPLTHPTIVSPLSATYVPPARPETVRRIRSSASSRRASWSSWGARWSFLIVREISFLARQQLKGR